MSVSVVVTNHNYARFLPKCIDSALEFCDEVLVYDDGSTDDSLDVLAGYGDRIRLECNPVASGDPVWGSNLGIRDFTSTHLIFLDADNWLTRRPPETEFDYTFCDLPITDESGCVVSGWTFEGWPTTAHDALHKFLSGQGMPFPWGGVWHRRFVEDKRWRRWRGTGFAADYRTAVDWCLDSPTLHYGGETFMSFRSHDGQWSGQTEQAAICERDVIRVLDNLKQLLDMP